MERFYPVCSEMLGRDNVRQRLGARDSQDVRLFRSDISALFGVAPQPAGSGAPLQVPKLRTRDGVPSSCLPFQLPPSLPTPCGRPTPVQLPWSKSWLSLSTLCDLGQVS